MQSGRPLLGLFWIGVSVVIALTPLSALAQSPIAEPTEVAPESGAESAAPAADVVDLFEGPPGALGWWAFDPRRFGSAEGRVERGLLEAGMQAALAAGLIDDQDAAYVVAALLGASVAGAAPHRLAVLDFAAKPAGRDGGMAIERLQMVLELRTEDDHRRIVRAIRSIVIEAEDVEEDTRPTGRQRTFEFGEGREANAYLRDGWPEWREVSWHSSDEAFYVGLGRGALERWFAGDPGPDWPGAGDWSAHAGAVAERREGETFFNAYCDIDALRRAFPEAFSGGRAARFLASFGLSNARDFMLHGRWNAQPSGPAIVGLDASWSARSRRPDVVRVGRLSTNEWPEGARNPAEPAGSYAIVVRGEWTAWLSLALNAYGGTLGEFDAMTYEARVSRWGRAHAAVYQRLASRLGDWVVLSDAPTPPAPIPGLATIFAEAKPGQTAAAIEADLAQVLGSVGEDRLVRDEAAGVWSLRVLPKEADPAGILRAASFAVVDRGERPAVLLISWSPAAVAEARDRVLAAE
ncbi:MAG: hypothetical protein AAF138_09495 [Planctomycetota bacterium]